MKFKTEKIFKIKWESLIFNLAGHERRNIDEFVNLIDMYAHVIANLTENINFDNRYYESWVHSQSLDFDE